MRAKLIGTMSSQLSFSYRIAVTDSILSVLAECINRDSKRPGSFFHDDRQLDFANKCRGEPLAVATRKYHFLTNQLVLLI